MAYLCPSHPGDHALVPQCAGELTAKGVPPLLSAEALLHLRGLVRHGRSPVRSVADCEAAEVSPVAQHWQGLDHVGAVSFLHMVERTQEDVCHSALPEEDRVIVVLLTSRSGVQRTSSTWPRAEAPPDSPKGKSKKIIII
ncbi:hypothetical protein NDU88_004507 [Pleurodeles waltl]|uniref:Uncharacterized protein n=1 Tax=Pleurodeles waltl TaxID=8319 RepID=A0AAV7RJC7_PLEWA|nr:hypothetical protein NDU88_004507 [Pleurodeles waltl]